MGEFRLEASEFQDLTTWRWTLTDAGGTLVAEHEVRLDHRTWQYEAFKNLEWYLRWRVAPDKRIQDEARIVCAVGEWIGAEVLGPLAAALVEVARAQPATVRVMVPSEPVEARSLLFWPLELARVGGKPLAVQDVTLIMCPGKNEDATMAGPVGERLRVLGLFSLPEGGRPLSLRRERQALIRLVSDIAATGRAADLQVLHYGVTRKRLHDLLQDGQGWDLIHISGHGRPGDLLLEKADGSPDTVNAADLARLLESGKDRIKLVTLSACWSAALTTADQRRLLGLPTVAPRDEEASRSAVSCDAAHSDADDDGDAAGVLAAELAWRLQCAVLAMRYPVTDDFAIALTGKLYDLLARQGQPLGQALGIALKDTVSDPPTAACPALSAGTPTLFGGHAIGLRLAAPVKTGAEPYDGGMRKMAGFPAQPERFVGRTSVMARASAALAIASGVPGVLLHGMPGAGKTACAVELAYTHEHAFDRLIWFKIRDETRDVWGALTDFALTLEHELDGFQMVHVLTVDADFTAFLPRLTELLERRRVLIVVDNIESLLSEDGQWHDARWRQVLGALCAHTGPGRVVLTSRRLPVRVTGEVDLRAGRTGGRAVGLLVQAVNALSLDEALLLARELPHLRDLIQGHPYGLDRDTARRLALGVLKVAQGHPKLLELADGQAADPARLATLVQVGDQAWRQTGGLPEDFFTSGEPQSAGEDYLRVLTSWTEAVSAMLTPGELTMFRFLCCLEEATAFALSPSQPGRTYGVG